MADRSDRSTKGPKARTVMAREILEVFQDTAAFLSAQGIISAFRSLSNAFTANITNRAVPADATSDATTKELIKQLEQNVDALELPTQTKQEMKISLVGRMLEQVSALSKASDAERPLMLFKIRTEMASDIAKLQQKRQSFQTRVFEMLTQDQQNKLVQIEIWFCDGRRQRWLTVRESIESPAVVAAALVETDKVPKSTPVTDAQKEETCETFLKILEGMTAKPPAPPKLSAEQWLDKFGKDNPVMGKVIKDGAVLMGLTPDPVPQMQRGQSEAQYRAQLAPLNLPAKDLEARVRGEMQRIRLETSRETREQGNRSFANSLNSPDAPRFPPMGASETREAYRRRVRDFFRSTTELDAHVLREWIRMKKPETRVGYMARIAPNFPDPAVLLAQVNAECARLGKP